MSDAELVAVEVDFGTISGYFVRLEVEIPKNTLYNATREDGGPMGYLALSPDEADALCDQLRDRAARVRSLRA